MLPGFGASIQANHECIAVDGGQRLRGAFVEVPGDPSSAAFWVAAALITEGSELTLCDVSLNPTRTGFLDAARGMGAQIEVALRCREPEPIGTVFARSSELHALTIGADEVPALIDELPLIAVLATQARGRTVVRGAAELRIKESDRIDAIATMLQAMGAEIEVYDDGFAIDGPQPLRGAHTDSRGDHRIAMAAAIAALAASGTTTIHDAECVAVSYPAFFRALVTLSLSKGAA